VVLSLPRSKCMPILLYAVEACPLLARQTPSFEFTLTRIVMKLFRTGSSKVVNECQVRIGFCQKPDVFFFHVFFMFLLTVYVVVFYQ